MENALYNRPAVADAAPRSLPTLGLLPVIAVTAAFAGPVAAQTAQTGTVALDEVTVEAGSTVGYLARQSASGKATAPLLDTPKSVTVITRQQITERGQTSLADVLRTTPGITLGAAEGGTAMGDRPSIRGFDATQDMAIDGMRNVARTSYEAFNLESIEIAKGSDGATNGRGAAGGAIGLYTKTPQAEDFIDTTLSFGTGNFRRGTLDYNKVVDNFGLRLNVMAQGADDLNGRKGVSSERYGIAPSLSYDMGDAGKITAGLYYYVNHDMPDHGLTMSTANVPAALRVGSGTKADPYMPVAGQPNDIWFGLNDKDFRDQTSKYAQLSYERDLGGLKWDTRLRISEDDNFYVITKGIASSSGNRNLATRGNTSSAKTTKATTFNTQLSGEQMVAGMTHNFAIGLDFSREEASAQGTTTTAGTIPQASYLNPNPNDRWTGRTLRGAEQTSQVNYSTGIYLLDTVKFAPQWEGTFGLRFDKYRTGFNNYVYTAPSSRNPNPLPIGHFSNETTFWNGSAGLTYKPTENTAIYASLGSSSSPVATGGVDSSDGLSMATKDLGAERNISREIGAKWQNDAATFMLTGAIFEVEKRNARVTDELGNTSLIGNTRTRGFELGFAGQVTDKLNLSGGYTYLDAEYVDAGFSNGRPSANNGNSVAGIVPRSFSIWGTYEVNDKIDLGLGATHQSWRYANAGNTAAIPSSTQVDAMASYTFNDQTALRLNVTNLFNETVYGNAHINGSEQVNVGAARTVALTLNHRF